MNMITIITFATAPIAVNFVGRVACAIIVQRPSQPSSKFVQMRKGNNVSFFGMLSNRERKRNGKKKKCRKKKVSPLSYKKKNLTLPLWRGMAHCHGVLPRSSRRPTCATTRPPIPQLTTPTNLYLL
jgi:hypothetical protein